MTLPRSKLEKTPPPAPKPRQGFVWMIAILPLMLLLLPAVASPILVGIVATILLVSFDHASLKKCNCFVPRWAFAFAILLPFVYLRVRANHSNTSQGPFWINLLIYVLGVLVLI